MPPLPAFSVESVAAAVRRTTLSSQSRSQQHHSLPPLLGFHHYTAALLFRQALDKTLLIDRHVQVVCRQERSICSLERYISMVKCTVTVKDFDLVKEKKKEFL